MIVLESEMRALILNSGTGKRMGDLTKDRPKCMVEIKQGLTIIQNQIRILIECGITDIVITTGPFKELLEYHVCTSFPNLKISFINNPQYEETNYIYSIFIAKDFLKDDLLMIHGDLIFERQVLELLLSQQKSSVVVCENIALPEKDFKAVIQNNKVLAIGIEYFNGCLPSQPIYKLLKADWLIWLDEIITYCNTIDKTSYAEKALNNITSKIDLQPLCIGDLLCGEVDTLNDLKMFRQSAKGIL